MSSITSNTSQLYRITYEAFSKFANDVNRCEKISEVGEVCKTHLKYLINFRIIRMTIDRDDKFLFFELYGSEIWYDIQEKSSLLPYERELLKKGVPICTNEIPDKLVRGKIDLTKLVDPVLWGWCFTKYDKNVIVSLLCDQEKVFSVGDIEILKLVVDCVQSKFNEIYLKRQLANRNQNLSEAYDTIKDQNKEISRIVENQKKTIEDRTREIVQKNEKLLHISALNAHNVREPLSRIQGIIQLFDFFDDEACRNELIPKLEETVEEMDKVLQEVIEMASKELVELKANKL